MKKADAPGAASALVERVIAACRRLADFPRSGRARPELGVRVRSFPVHPYVLFYRPTRYGIEVVRLLHQGEDQERAFKRRRRPPGGRGRRGKRNPRNRKTG